MRRTDKKTHRMYPIGKTCRRMAINGIYDSADNQSSITAEENNQSSVKEKEVNETN